MNSESPLSRKAGHLYLWGHVSQHVKDLWKTPSAHPFFKDSMVRHVAVGSGFTAVLSEEGEVYTMGSQSWFSLLQEPVEEEEGKKSAPEAQKHDITVVKHWTELSGKEVTHLCCGHNFLVALTLTGAVYAWGTDTNGQLGIGSNEEENRREKVDVPQLVESLPQMTQIACGDEFVVAIDIDGKCWSWGRGESGALGHGNENNVYAPKMIQAMEKHTVVALSCGALHTALLTDTKDLFTFGSNILGQLGRIISQSKEFDPTPQQVELIQMGNTVSEDTLKQIDEVEFVALTCLRLNTIALTSEGKLFSCGKGGTDGSGNSSNPHTLFCIMESVRDITFTRLIRSRWTHAAAIAEDGSVWIWGNNDYHQLGLQNNSSSKLEPVVLFPKEGSEGHRIVYDMCCDEMHTAAIFEPFEEIEFPTEEERDATTDINMSNTDEKESSGSATEGEEKEVPPEMKNNDNNNDTDDSNNDNNNDDVEKVQHESAVDDTNEQVQEKQPDEAKASAADGNDEEEAHVENEDESDEESDVDEESAAKSNEEGEDTEAAQTPGDSVEDGEVKCSGYLQKRGEKGIVKLWRKRWFVLTESKLTYYEKQGGTKKGSVDVKNMLDVLSGGSPLSFNITTRGKRTYELQALKKEELAMWTAAINDVLSGK